VPCRCSISPLNLSYTAHSTPRTYFPLLNKVLKVFPCSKTLQKKSLPRNLNRLRVWHKQSSSCWDPIPEFLALALKFRLVYKTFKNTRAGITKGCAFAQKAKIRVTRIHDHDDTDHVEILFEGDKERFGPATLALNARRSSLSASPATSKVYQSTPTMLSLEEMPHEPIATADPHSDPSSRSPSPLPIQHIASLLLVPQAPRHARSGPSGSDRPLTSINAQSSAVEAVQVDELNG